MILFSPSFFLLSPLACALWSLVYFPSQMYGDGADVGWELCWGPRVPVVWSGCWSLVVLGACLQCHFCGVGVGLCLVFWVWGLFMVCFSCLIVVWVVAWGLVMGCCVVCVSSSVFVVCAIAVFRFLVSPILVNHFCCWLCFSFRERSDWKRVVVSSSGSSYSVVSTKVTCVPCLVAQFLFLFYLLSCHSSQDWSSGSGIGWLCAQRRLSACDSSISGLFAVLTLLLYCHLCLGLDVVPFRGPGLEFGLGLGCVLGLGWSWLFWSWS